jgi:catechol-2,3-dioxygenase
MLTAPEWLTLEAKDVDRLTAFYDAVLELDVVEERDAETVLAAGETELRLRAPGPVPRGGLHTHYALTVPEREYDDWYDRLDERFDLVEHSFGDARSLYCYDSEGNCVELGERPLKARRSGITGLFELVLEVEQLDEAVDFYERLGFEIVDDGREDGRVRLTTGEFDLELWSPRLGIADARGGVHVDFGVAADDPRSTAREVADDAPAVTSVEEGVRIRDPDGHYVTLVG